MKKETFDKKISAKQQQNQISTSESKDNLSSSYTEMQLAKYES
jgi:hypothetical protein